MSRGPEQGGTLADAALPLVAQGQDEHRPASPEATDVRIRIGFNNLTLTATLSDNPTARDLASMLPLNLKIEDYGRNEKIVHL
ncbi:cyclophilin-like fold protein, partial [Rhizobium leguminosarum]|uniref:cyclophilin-like fold protein n=1 Tax=Rhizobium leguminosarum TaxID=384 RepID=UPI003F9B18B9